MMSGTGQNRAHGRAEVLAGARPRPRDRSRRGAGWQALGLALVVALASPSAGAVSIGGPFELVDQEGARRTDADFRGRYLVMYFGFTHCPDTCPTVLLKMTNALEELAELDAAKAERVVPIFVSVDPERDTPEALRSYAENFHPRLVALTGTPRQLEEVGRTYGVFFAKVPTGAPGEYVIDHTGFVYLIGPDGNYLEHFESDASVDDLLDALRREVVAAELSGD
jgi:cytochrome oxidase Cu insertion factor (SCO1/SenC/PrrC family)